MKDAFECWPNSLNVVVVVIAAAVKQAVAVVGLDIGSGTIMMAPVDVGRGSRIVGRIYGDLGTPCVSAYLSEGIPLAMCSTCSLLHVVYFCDR